MIVVMLEQLSNPVFLFCFCGEIILQHLCTQLYRRIYCVCPGFILFIEFPALFLEAVPWDEVCNLAQPASLVCTTTHIPWTNENNWEIGRFENTGSWQNETSVQTGKLNSRFCPWLPYKW